MAKILCVTSGLPGILYSSLELTRRLARVGHQVTYASFADAQPTVEAHGVPFVGLDPSQYRNFLSTDSQKSVVERLRTLPRRLDAALESVAVGRFNDIVTEANPDLLLIDGEMHEHIIAGSATNPTIVLLNTFASIWRRPGLPPPHLLVRPGVGWRGTRVAISLRWLELRIRKWLRARWQRVHRVGCDRVSVLRQLARRVAFDFRRETDAGQWLVPFTYRHFPTLSLHALEFEFTHAPPEDVHYVGPMVARTRADHRAPDSVETDLVSVFARRKLDGNSRTLIYAGFGSCFSADVGLVRRLIEAVSTREDWDLVVSVANRVSRADWGTLPSNVKIFPWVPQLTVLEHADVAVTHGGINTVDEAVVCRVPMLVYCGFETDMAGNAARIEHHGIGMIGDARRDGVDIIRRRIDRLRHDPSYAQRIGALAAVYAAYVDTRVAERTVHMLVDRTATAS